jgi:hypothetical protein
MYLCSFCNTYFTTSGGVNNHQSQSKSCKRKLQNYLETLDDDEGLDAAADISQAEPEDGSPTTFGINDVESSSIPGTVDDIEAGGYDDTVMNGVAGESEVDDKEREENEQPQGRPEKRARVWIEEDEDSEPTLETRQCPVVDRFPRAGTGLRQSKTSFERIRARQEKQERPPWYPFESKSEWELAKWLVESGVTGKKIDEFLKLEKVRQLALAQLIIGE